MQALEIISQMVRYNYEDRPTLLELKDHEYFGTDIDGATKLKDMEVQAL